MKIWLMVVLKIFSLFSVQMFAMDLNDDVWMSIIACSDSATKNAIGKTCVGLNTVYSKNNLSLYLCSPLVLTQRQGEYALSLCTYNNCVPAVKNLLRHKAKLRYTWCGIDTCARSIAEYNNNQELIDLLKYYREGGVGFRNRFIEPYALAAYVGDIKVLHKYVKSPHFNPLYKRLAEGEDHSTLLLMAILNGHRDVVELLLRHKETIRHINYGTKGSGRPIDMALFTGNADIVERLLTIPSLRMKGRDYIAKHAYTCSRKGYVECIKLLLKNNLSCINRCALGCVLNVCGKRDIFLLSYIFGRIAPLTIAAYKGHSNVVEFLLSCEKINVNISLCAQDGTSYDFTPLYAASLNGHTKIVELLLGRPDINPLMYMEAYSPLHIACTQGYVDIVRMLVEHCPALLKMNTKYTNESPIALAQRHGQQAVVQFLRFFYASFLDIQMHQG